MLWLRENRRTRFSVPAQQIHATAQRPYPGLIAGSMIADMLPSEVSIRGSAP